MKRRPNSPDPSPAPALRTAVETIPGVVALDAFFDALFTLATRVEYATVPLTKAA